MNLLNKNMLRGSSETLRNGSGTTYCIENTGFDFYWLAGLIDACGGFYISRNRYVSCEITMHEKEIQTLYYIKKFLGGTVQPRSGKKAYRWRLHKKKPLLDILERLNGRICTNRVSTQFAKACGVFEIIPRPPKKITLDTAWFSGFFSGDGSFSITAGYQPCMSISQADKSILDKIAIVVGGNVYFDRSWNGWIWWLDVRKNPSICEYFQKYPLRNPLKQARNKSMIRFCGYLERGLHRDPNSRARIDHFVRLFQKNCIYQGPDQDKVRDVKALV